MVRVEFYKSMQGCISSFMNSRMVYGVCSGLYES